MSSHFPVLDKEHYAAAGKLLSNFEQKVITSPKEGGLASAGPPMYQHKETKTMGIDVALTAVDDNDSSCKLHTLSEAGAGECSEGLPSSKATNC